jgi:tetratricopeptide (TPR) repeat protein
MRLVLILLCAWFSGLAAAQGLFGAIQQGSAPAGDNQPAMAEDQAARLVVEDAKRRGFSGIAVYGRELQAFSPPSWVQSVNVDAERIEIVHERGRIALPLADLAKVEVVTDTVMGISQFGVAVNASEVLWMIDGGFDSSSRRERARRYADALLALKSAGAGSGESDVQFEIMARNYRSADPKPGIPEEVRKYQVQADFAIDLKRYRDAAQFYAEGIKLAPWWATGRFNRALLLAEAGQFREAATEMRRFLVLAPDSPDARVAQDRIYQWEAAAQLRR